MCEPPTIYRVSESLARKQHRCCECRGVIDAGEKYFRHEGLWDGKWSTYKVCPDCEALRKRVDAGVRDPYELTPFLCLGEYAGENIDTGLAFVAIMRKRRVEIPPSWESFERKASGLE